MAKREPISDRRAVVHDVHRVFIQLQLLGESFDDVGHVLKCVREARPIRHAAKAVSGLVGSNHAERRRETRYQVAEHIRRCGKAMQEKKHGSGLGAGVAIEDFNPVDSNGVVVDRCRRVESGVR